MEKPNQTRREPAAQVERFGGLIELKGEAAQAADSKERMRSCVAYSGASVDRFDWWTGERYKLRLSMEPGAWDFSRVDANACPVLDDHQSYGGSASVIGKVAAASQSKVIKADLLFSSDPGVDSIWNKIQEGIIASVSVGVAIPQGTLFKESAEDEKPARYVATKPVLMEISPTGMPADMNAGFLSAQLGRDTINLKQLVAEDKQQQTEGLSARKEEDMEKTMNPQPAGGSPPPDAAKAQVLSIEEAQKVADNAASLAVQTERKRTSDIRSIVKQHNLSEDFATQAINEGWGMEKVREEALNAMATDQQRYKTKEHVPARITSDGREKLNAGLENALELRANPKATAEVQKLGRDYASRPMVEMARLCLENAGVSTLGMNNDMIATVALNPRHEKFAGMHSTSDFPNILANVANKSLRRAYEAAPKTYQMFCRMATTTDFKPVARVQLSDISGLSSVNEHGEFKRVTVGDSKETYSLGTFGGIIAITRRVIVNDDLSALERIPSGLGVSCANFESDTVWAIITANGNMADTVALFHSTHKNLNTSNPLTNATNATDNIGKGRAAMRKQTAPKGTKLNVAPRYLITSVTQETEALRLLFPTQLAAGTVGAVVPDHVRNLTLITEPRLDDASNGTTTWYLAADPGESQIDTIEYCYLQGQEGVHTETQYGFEVDGVEVKVRQDFAAGAIEFRGLQKNTA